MYVNRWRYEMEQKKYFTNLREEFGRIPDNHLKAIDLRMSFFREWVLNRKTTDYITNTEKDWSYVSRRVDYIYYIRNIVGTLLLELYQIASQPELLHA